jgi:hypothetical protein
MDPTDRFHRSVLHRFRIAWNQTGSGKASVNDPRPSRFTASHACYENHMSDQLAPTFFSIFSRSSSC